MLRSFLMLGLVLTGLSSAPSLAADKAEMQKAYTTFLQSKNLTSTVDADGDVQFQVQQSGHTRTLFIEVDPNDPTFVRIVLPNIWPIESEDERKKVLAACDKANAKLKVAKVYTANDNVWVAVELFVAAPDQYQPSFDRSLTVISQAVDVFVENM